MPFSVTGWAHSRATGVIDLLHSNNVGARVTMTAGLQAIGTFTRTRSLNIILWKKCVLCCIFHLTH